MKRVVLVGVVAGLVAILTACGSTDARGGDASAFINGDSVILNGHPDFVVKSAGLSAETDSTWIRGVVEVEYTGSSPHAYIRANDVVFRGVDGRELFKDTSFFRNCSTMRVGSNYTTTYVTETDRQVRYHIIEDLGEHGVVISDIATIEIDISVSGSSAVPEEPEARFVPSGTPYLETGGGVSLVYKEFSNQGSEPAVNSLSRITYTNSDGVQVYWAFMYGLEHKLDGAWTSSSSDDPIGPAQSARIRDSVPGPTRVNTTLSVGTVSLSWREPTVTSSSLFSTATVVGSTGSRDERDRALRDELDLISEAQSRE